MTETPVSELRFAFGQRRRRNGQSHLLAVSAAFILALAAALAAAASAEDASIRIKDAWARATPAGAKVAAGYLTIVNEGAEPDRLLSADAPFAGAAEIHQTRMADGVMKMRRATDGVAVPPKGTVVLAPSSYHLMFTRLSEALQESDSVHGTLNFERAGKVEVTCQVLVLGAKGPQPAPHHH